MSSSSQTNFALWWPSISAVWRGGGGGGVEWVRMSLSVNLIVQSELVSFHQLVAMHYPISLLFLQATSTAPMLDYSMTGYIHFPRLSPNDHRCEADMGQIYNCFGFKYFSTLYWACLVYWNRWHTLKMCNPHFLVFLVGLNCTRQEQSSTEKSIWIQKNYKLDPGLVGSVKPTQHTASPRWPACRPKIFESMKMYKQWWEFVSLCPWLQCYSAVKWCGIAVEYLSVVLTTEGGGERGLLDQLNCRTFRCSDPQEKLTPNHVICFSVILTFERF